LDQQVGNCQFFFFQFLCDRTCFGMLPFYISLIRAIAEKLMGWEPFKLCDRLLELLSHTSEVIKTLKSRYFLDFNPTFSLGISVRLSQDIPNLTQINFNAPQCIDKPQQQSKLEQN
jgi:hypothetical protein